MNIKKIFISIALLALTRFSIGQRHITLSESIQLALENNYDILLFKNYSEATNVNQKLSVGVFTPQINGIASQLWIQNDQKQTLADNTERNKNGIRSENFTSSIQLNWTLFDGTKMFITRRKMDELAVQGNIALKREMVNSVSQVVTGYFRLVKEKQQIRAINEQILISEIRVQLAAKKLEVGAGSKPELLQAKVDLNAQRSSLLKQEALILQLKENFKALLGSKTIDEFEVADSIPIDVNLEKERFLKGFEERSLDLAILKKDVNIATLNLAERKAERYPVISFNSAYNFTRNNNRAVVNPFSPLFTQNNGFNYGFSATMPIFRGFEFRRAIRVAEYEVHNGELRYQQQKTYLTTDIKNAFTAYEKAKIILSIEEENIGLAKENIDIALERFKRGLGTFIEVRTAQFSLADAYTRLISARYDTKVAETELLRLSDSLLY